MGKLVRKRLPVLLADPRVRFESGGPDVHHGLGVDGLFSGSERGNLRRRGVILPLCVGDIYIISAQDSSHRAVSGCHGQAGERQKRFCHRASVVCLPNDKEPSELSDSLTHPA